MTTKKIQLSPLPYAEQALEPHISAETLHYHHDKHMAAYVDKLNTLIADTPFAEASSLEEIILQSEGAIFNNAAQAWNHAFYFEQFHPKPKREPEGELKAAIEKAFGSVEQLREQLERDAVALFGSGWVWLAADKHGELSIVSKPNAGNPLTEGMYPLLTIDVWEHAYYIDHRNARATGVKALWEVLCWGKIEHRYSQVGRNR
ncbi:MAG: superoxide dismutase [Rikenellaceae bacterium]|nr:superoxide dismutase [Rikenellaceae bacterium]